MVAITLGYDLNSLFSDRHCPKLLHGIEMLVPAAYKQSEANLAVGPGRTHYKTNLKP